MALALAGVGATYMHRPVRSDTQGKCDIHRTVSHSLALLGGDG
jgi:hypothetical protein